MHSQDGALLYIQWVELQHQDQVGKSLLVFVVAVSRLAWTSVGSGTKAGGVSAYTMCVFVVICEVKRMQIVFYTNLSGTIFFIASCNYTASLGPRLLWWQLAYGSPQLVIFAKFS